MVERVQPWRFQVPATAVAERVHDDFHLLAWQVLGSTEFLLEGESFETARGQALWVPEGVRHSLRVAANSVVFPLFFRGQGARAAIPDPTLVAVGRDLQQVLLGLTQVQHSIIRPAADLERQALSMISRNRIAPSRVPMPRNSTAAAKIAAMLRANPGDDRSVPELAAAAAVSVSTLERRFVEGTGMTLREWRLRNRMEAAGLLLRDLESIAVVASRVGYVSVSAFHRAFRRHFGLTPRAYVARFGGDSGLLPG